MGIQHTSTIECDVRADSDCWEDDTEHGPPTAAIRYWRSQGWRISNGPATIARTVCPNCRGKRR